MPKIWVEGVFPIDVEIDIRYGREAGLCICAVNESLIKSYEIVIADLFRLEVQALTLEQSMKGVLRTD